MKRKSSFGSELRHGSVYVIFALSRSLKKSIRMLSELLRSDRIVRKKEFGLDKLLEEVVNSDKFRSVCEF